MARRVLPVPRWPWRSGVILALHRGCFHFPDSLFLVIPQTEMVPGLADEPGVDRGNILLEERDQVLGGVPSLHGPRMVGRGAHIEEPGVGLLL